MVFLKNAMLRDETLSIITYMNFSGKKEKTQNFMVHMSKDVSIIGAAKADASVSYFNSLETEFGLLFSIGVPTFGIEYKKTKKLTTISNFLFTFQEINGNEIHILMHPLDCVKNTFSCLGC